MRSGAPPEVTGAPEDRQGFPWKLALARGLFAFVLVAVAGQITPLLMNLFGAGLAWSTALKLGWFYALAFHHVAIASGGPTGPRSDISVAFMTGTAFATWMLFREGKRVAGRDAGARAAALAGAAIAPAYAAPFLVLTLLVHVDLVGLPLLPQVTRIDGVAWQAFVFPLALAAIAGSVGGLMRSLPGDPLLSASLVGGWRMLLGGLAAAVVGLLLVAAFRPAGLATYARVVGDHGAKPAGLMLGHQGLLLPNIALDVLIPSMGGCVGFHTERHEIPVLCPGKLPRLDAPDVVLVLGGGVPNPPRLSRSMPPGYLLLLAIPGFATIWGGWTAAARVSRSEARLAAGAAAGCVFATLVGAACWLASVTLRREGSLTFGARPFASAMLALAWGLAGGVVGAVLARRQLVVPDDEPPPPSPTSV